MNKPENIDDLISKFLSGEASPEEAMLLEDWKDEREDHARYYASSEKIWSLTHDQRITEPDSDSAWRKVNMNIQQAQEIKPLHRKLSYVRIAAVFIGIVMMGFIAAYLFQDKPSSHIISASGNQPQQVTLPDGTDITLSPKARLELDKGFGKRNRSLHLIGNAYFSVKHQDDLPFIIDAGGVFIKDIGTRFSVRSSLDTDTVYVHVDEGIVLLFDSLGSAIEIRANGQALYIKSKKQLVNLVPKPKVEALQFEHAALGEVIQKINEVYQTSIVLENPRVKDCRITTQFNHEDLETVIGIITETLGLSYEKTTSGYLIKGNSCHS